MAISVPPGESLPEGEAGKQSLEIEKFPIMSFEHVDLALPEAGPISGLFSQVGQ